MQTFKLTSLPIEQVDDLDAFAWKLGQFFAARSYPVRFIATSRPFDMDAPIRALQREQQELHRLARVAGPLLGAIDVRLAGGDDDPRAVVAALDADGRALLGGLFAVTPALHAQLFGAPAAAATPLEADEAWTAIANALSRLL